MRQAGANVRYVPLADIGQLSGVYQAFFQRAGVVTRGAGA
jgi:hypothetical protein